jgi:hypothetical protein
MISSFGVAREPGLARIIHQVDQPGPDGTGGAVLNLWETPKRFLAYF